MGKPLPPQFCWHRCNRALQREVWRGPAAHALIPGTRAPGRRGRIQGKPLGEFPRRHYRLKAELRRLVGLLEPSPAPGVFLSQKEDTQMPLDNPTRDEITGLKRPTGMR